MNLQEKINEFRLQILNDEVFYKYLQFVYNEESASSLMFTIADKTRISIKPKEFEPLQKMILELANKELY